MFKCWYLLYGIVLSSTQNTCNWNSSGEWTFHFLQLLSLLHLGTMCSQSSLSDCWAPIVLYGIWHGPMSRIVLLKRDFHTWNKMQCWTLCSFYMYLGESSLYNKIWYVKSVCWRWVPAKSFYFVSEIHLNMMF